MKCSMMTAMVNVKIASGEVVWKTKDFFFQIENVLKKGDLPLYVCKKKTKNNPPATSATFIFASSTSRTRKERKVLP